MANEGANVETELSETTLTQVPQKKGRKKAAATNSVKRGRKKTAKEELKEPLPKVEEEDEGVEKVEDDSETVAKEENGKEGRDGSEEECDGCEEGCDNCEEEEEEEEEQGEEEEEQEEGEEQGEEGEEQGEEEEEEDEEEDSDNDKVYDNEGILIVRNEIPWPLLWAISVLLFVQSIKVFLSLDEVFCTKQCTFVK